MAELTLWAGILSALTTTVIAAPQAVRAFRVGTAGVSVVTFQLFCGLALMWMVYGEYENYLPITLSNGFQFITCAAVLYACGRGRGNWLQVTRIAIVTTALAAVAALLFGIPAMIWMSITVSVGLRVPQLRAAATEPKVDGISLGTWWIAVATNACAFVYGIGNHDPRLITACVLNGSASYAIIAVVQLRQRRHIALRAA